MLVAPGFFHARKRTVRSFLKDSIPKTKFELLMANLLFSERSLRLLTGALLILALTGCGSSSRLNYDTPQEAFEKGKEYFDQENYSRAIDYLQGAFDFGRTHQWAADAQIYLARAYRGNKDFLLAANEYTRFTQIYRSDDRVPDADYELALTYFDRSPEFDKDQTDTERAITQFRLFSSRYREHPLVLEAQHRIRELREKLARKQFEIARLYERRGMFEAAALSFDSVFDNYYDSIWADDALYGAMRMYLAYSEQSITARQVERLEMAIESYDRLIQIFPDSPIVRDAETLYLRINQQLEALQQGS